MALARSPAAGFAVCGPSASHEPRSCPSQTGGPRPSVRPAPLSQSLSKGASQPVSGAIGAKPWAIRAVEAAAPAEAETVPIEQSFPAPPTVLDINKIKEMLPHRFPFLLVDRVIEYEPGKSAVGLKNVTVNDNFFPGHFPERPIMPGVLMVEAMAQVGGLVLLTDEVGGNKESFFFAGVDKIRFRKPVVPGDTLIMKMTLIKIQKSFGIAKMSGKAYVGKDVVCDGEFLLALGS